MSSSPDFVIGLHLVARDSGKGGLCFKVENQKFFYCRKWGSEYWEETSSFFHKVLSLVSKRREKKKLGVR